MHSLRGLPPLSFVNRFNRGDPFQTGLHQSVAGASSAHRGTTRHVPLAAVVLNDLLCTSARDNYERWHDMSISTADIVHHCIHLAAEHILVHDGDFSNRGDAAEIKRLVTPSATLVHNTAPRAVRLSCVVKLPPSRNLIYVDA
jgi:hypothetical protein